MFKEILSSVQNPLVKHLVKIRENRRYRLEHRQVLISGRKLCLELAAQIRPTKVFVVKDFVDIPECEEIYLVSENILKKISNLPSPDGIAIEFPLPSPSTLEKKSSILALDRVADPGNVGTLIRTALALGWESIFFLPNCADPFHEKVIRASQGGLFHLPWRTGNWEELKELISENHLTAYVADMEGTPLLEIQKQDKRLLLLSSEGMGVSEEAERLENKVAIPMSGEVESLNVAIAGAILMYAL